MLKREDIVNAYRFILGREPESEEVIQRHLKSLENQSVSDLMAIFFYSEEYQDKVYASRCHDLSGFEVGDLPLLKKYMCKDAKPQEGYVLDWLGIYSKLSDLPFLPSNYNGKALQGLPIPTDGMHAATIEYVALLTAIEHASDSFTMIECGAGWGPWICAGGVVAKRRGFKNINLVGIEGETNKMPLMFRHLTKNGLRPNNDELVNSFDGIRTEIINGVVNDGSIALFPDADFSQYGASLLMADSYQGNLLRIQGYTMEQLTRSFDFVDFVHIDIQGSEEDLMRDQVNVFKDKVHYVAIGTHTRRIESFLIEQMSRNGFRLLREQPCVMKRFEELPDNLVDITYIDGMQFWENKKYC